MRTLLNSSKSQKVMKAFAMVAMVAAFGMLCINMPFAAEQIQSVLTEMIGIIGVIFQAVGVILSVYSVGQLVLAFKNEDADSKSRASTMLVVGVALIAIPGLIESLDLISMIGG